MISHSSAKDSERYDFFLHKPKKKYRKIKHIKFRKEKRFITFTVTNTSCMNGFGGQLGQSNDLLILESQIRHHQRYFTWKKWCHASGVDS